MILATRHTGIVVRDMEKCLRFWRDVMGLEVKVDAREEGQFIETIQHLDGVKLRMIKLSAPDGSMIELLKDDGHPSVPGKSNCLCDHGIRHIAFTVARVEECYRVLRREGFETLSEPTVAPDGKAKLFFARDPEGNLLELVQMLDPGTAVDDDG